MGAVFALSSLLTPFFMGTVVGAIVAGEVPAGGSGDAFSSWTAPLPLLTGGLFVATSAYLAAVFLVSDARRAGAPDLERYWFIQPLAATTEKAPPTPATTIGMPDQKWAQPLSRFQPYR
jgi:cytochrome bd-type quinol oxidase subunit 2